MGSDIATPPEGCVTPGKALRGRGASAIWAPVLAFALVIAALNLSPHRPVEGPGWLLTACNLLLLTTISLLVAVLASGSYLTGGPRAVLLLGSGTLAVGLAAALAGLAIPQGRHDSAVVIYNTAFLMSGTCNLIGAVRLVTSARVRETRHLTTLVGSYGSVIVFVAALVWAESSDLVPTFFEQGKGATPLRQVVLGAAIVQMGIASAILLYVGRQTQSGFLRWYAPGLALMAVGLCGVLPIQDINSLQSWMGRISQYAGGVYLLVAVINAMRQSGRWSIPLESLREVHQLYTSLVTLSPDAILVHDGIRFVFANPAAANLLGAEDQEALIGREVLGHVHPDSRPVVQERLRQIRVSGSPAPMRDIKVLRLDGRTVDVEAFASRVEYEGQQAYQVVLRDVSVRKRSEESLAEAIRNAEEARARADQANQAKDQFLAVLSHELRTPLTPVLTVAQTMEEDQALPEAVRESAAMIRRNVELEARLIDDLLDLTRIARGKLRLNLASTDLHATLQHVVQICRAEIGEKRLELVLQLQADRHHLLADSARLQQVFWNLLKNAVKFTPARGSITLRTEVVDGMRIRVQVRDTGMGIEPQFLERLFMAFEQGGAEVTRRFGGLGLGLAISRSLAELHGGTLTAASDGKDQGATFTLELPLGASESEEVAGVHASAAVSGRGEGLRILLVEDHRDTGRVMQALLERQGYRVTWATTLAAARTHCASTAFDLLISDLGLPDGSGLELMREMSSRGGVRGIAISGFGMEEDIRRSQEVGFAEHLTKPIDLHRFGEALRRLSSGGQARGAQ